MGRIIILSLLMLTTVINGQMYDILQGYQPLPTYTPTKISDFINYPQNIGFTAINRDRDETISSISKEIEANINNFRKKLSTNELHNINFVTTPTPFRKTTKRNSLKNTNSGNHFSSLDTSKRRAPNYATKNQFDVNNIPGDFQAPKAKTNHPETNVYRRPDFVTNRPIVGSNNNHFATNAVPVAVSHYTTPITIRPGVKLADGDVNELVTNANSRHDYVTNRPSSVGNKNHFATNAVPTVDISYYTSPLTIRPGVKPADVDVNQPPITNKPPSEVQNDSPANEGTDREPDVVAGPDVNEMSSREQKRYEGLVENMCEKYKASSVKKVEAIPLVPSPEPVQVNVSACHPKKIPLVVGGKIVTIQEFPHMALLGWTKLLGGGYSWKCGGSLISERYVLTAGHCLYQDKDDTVVSGAPRIVQLGSSYMDDRRALLVGVETAIRHPKYIKTRAYYDVALLRLVREVVFSEVVKPACLGEPPAADEPVIATGWGKTEVAGSQSLELRSVSIPVWNMAECRQILGTSRKLPVGPSEDSQICAGEKEGGKDTCQGDSGGPAQVQEGCTWRIVAITSLGRSCGAINTPALYATINKAYIGAQLFGNINEANKQTNEKDNTDENTNKKNRPNTNYNTQMIGNNNKHDYSHHGVDNGFKRDYATSPESSISNYNINNGNNNNKKHDATKTDNNNDNSFNIKPITSLSNNDRRHNEQNYNSNNRDDNSNNNNNYYNSSVRPVSSSSNNNQRNNEYSSNNNRGENNYNNQRQDTHSNNDRLIFSTTTKIDRGIINKDHNFNIKPISGLTNNNNRHENSFNNQEVSHNDNNRGSFNTHNYNLALNNNKDISSSVNRNRNNNEKNEQQKSNIPKYNQHTNSRESVFNQNSTPATSNYYDRNINKNDNDNNKRFETSNNGHTVIMHNTNTNYNEDTDNTDRFNKHNSDENYDNNPINTNNNYRHQFNGNNRRDHINYNENGRRYS